MISLEGASGLGCRQVVDRLAAVDTGIVALGTLNLEPRSQFSPSVAAAGGVGRHLGVLLIPTLNGALHPPWTLSLGSSQDHVAAWVADDDLRAVVAVLGEQLITRGGVDDVDVDLIDQL